MTLVNNNVMMHGLCANKWSPTYQHNVSLWYVDLVDLAVYRQTVRWHMYMRSSNCPVFTVRFSVRADSRAGSGGSRNPNVRCKTQQARRCWLVYQTISHCYTLVIYYYMMRRWGWCFGVNVNKKNRFVQLMWVFFKYLLKMYSFVCVTFLFRLVFTCSFTFFP